MTGVPGALDAQLHAVQVLGGSTGGIGAHVGSLAHGLVARGLSVTVCGPASAEELYGLAKSGAGFRPVEIDDRAGPREDAAAVAVLRRFFLSANVVHAHGLRAGLLADLALRSVPGSFGLRRRTPLVVTLHHAAFAEGPRSHLLKLVERRVSRAADVILGASSDLVALARGRGAKDARLAPVAAPPPDPGVDPEAAWQAVRGELDAHKRPLLLAVGRLAPHKGYRVLLDAARAWRDLDPRPLLVIAGEGTERPTLQSRIDAERLPVRLLGRRADVSELLAASDVVVLPSRWEARALVAQEALLAGVPLVATAVGGVPELVGDAAVLVPYGDAAALADAVTELLADPVRRASLAEQGRAQAATWPDEDDTVTQILSIYDELAAPRR